MFHGRGGGDECTRAEMEEMRAVYHGRGAGDEYTRPVVGESTMMSVAWGSVSLVTTMAIPPDASASSWYRLFTVRLIPLLTFPLLALRRRAERAFVKKKVTYKRRE